MKYMQIFLPFSNSCLFAFWRFSFFSFFAGSLNAACISSKNCPISWVRATKKDTIISTYRNQDLPPNWSSTWVFGAFSWVVVVVSNPFILNNRPHSRVKKVNRPPNRVKKVKNEFFLKIEAFYTFSEKILVPDWLPGKWANSQRLLEWLSLIGRNNAIAIARCWLVGTD